MLLLAPACCVRHALWPARMVQRVLAPDKRAAAFGSKGQPFEAAVGLVWVAAAVFTIAL